MKKTIEERISLIKSARSQNNLSQEKAEYLIKIRASRAVIGNIKNFNIINPDKLAKQIIKKGESKALFRYINEFAGINQDTLLDQLVEHEEFDVLADHIDYFDTKHHDQVAKKLLQNSNLDLLVRNLNKFKSLDTNIIEALMSENAYNANSIIKNISSFNIPEDEVNSKIEWLKGNI